MSGMSNETRAALEIIIAEIRECATLDEVLHLTKTWVAVNALNWLAHTLDEGDVVLTHRVFYGWALQALDTDQIRYYGWGCPVAAAEAARQVGAAAVYAIWWVRGVGWNPMMPEPFQLVYSSNRIAVYEYP